MIVKEMTRPGDPAWSIVFVNTSDFIFDVALDSHDATIYLSKGAFDQVTTKTVAGQKVAAHEDRLWGFIAHEMAHSKTRLTVRGLERDVQKMREEILTADLGGMDRMLEAGRDPREFREGYLDLARQKGHLVSTPLIELFKATHPQDEMRITGMDAWMLKKEPARAFPDPRPLPAIFLKVRETTATPPLRETEPETPAPPPAPKKEVRSSYQRKTYPRVTFQSLLDRLASDPKFNEASGLVRIAFLRRLALDDALQNTLLTHLHKPQGNYLNYLNFSGDRFNPREARKSLSYFDEERRARAVTLNVTQSELGSPERPDFERIAKWIRDLGLERPELTESAMNAISDLSRYDWKLPLDEAARLQDTLTPRPPIVSVESCAPIFATPWGGPWSREQKLDTLFHLLATAQKPQDLATLFKKLGKQLSSNLDGNCLEDVPSKYRDLYLRRLPEMYEAAIRVGDNDLITGDGWPTDARSRTHTRTKITEVDQAHLNQRDGGMVDPRLTFRQRMKLLMWGAYSDSERSSRKKNLFKNHLPNLDALLGAADILYRTHLVEALKFHPEWKLSPSDVGKVVGQKQFWQNGGDGLSQSVKTLTGSDATNLAQQILTRRGESGLANSLKEAKRALEGPAYEYEPKSSEELQSLLVNQMKKYGTFPTDVQGRHTLFLQLASRGVTYLTDEMARELYLDSGQITAAQLEEILQKHLVWDFEYRKRIYLQQRHLEGRSQTILSGPRIPAILQEIEKINKAFPEQSLPRLQLLEALANDTQASREETDIIEAAKYPRDENVEGVALRGISAILGDLSTPKSRLAFIRFILGREEPTDEIIRLTTAVGPNRIRRQFQALTPELRALALNPLLCPPNGLYEDPKHRKTLIDLITRGLGREQRTGVLLVNGLLYALSKTSPYAESLHLSYLLAQSGTGEDLHPGQRLRILLESMGNTGVSIGQKLYQRRLVPADYLPYLRDLQDETRTPARAEIFRWIGEVLNNKDVDSILNLEEILGSASSKVVLRVRYKDGHEQSLGPEDRERALKLLRENFSRTTQLELQKIDFIQEYMEQFGGPEYKKFRSALQAVKRTMTLQADARAESRVHAELARLYQSGEVHEPSGFRFVVIAPDTERSMSERHVNEQVAQGKRMKDLDDAERARVFAAIYDKESEILFSSGVRAGSDQEWVEFEMDRHMGNWKVDLSTQPPTIFIYDYPLYSRIRPERRDAIFRLLGLAHMIQTAPRVPKVASKALVDTIAHDLSMNTAPALVRRLERLLNTESIRNCADLSGAVFQTLAIAEEAGLEVEPEVFDYLTALSNLELYGEAKRLNPRAPNPFRTLVESRVRTQIDPIAQQFTSLEKLKYRCWEWLRFWKE